MSNISYSGNEHKWNGHKEEVEVKEEVLDIALIPLEDIKTNITNTIKSLEDHQRVMSKKETYDALTSLESTLSILETIEID